MYYGTDLFSYQQTHKERNNKKEIFVVINTQNHFILISQDSMRRSIVQNGGLKLLTSILRTSAGINLRQEACRTMINLSLTGSFLCPCSQHFFDSEVWNDCSFETDENEGDFVVEKSIPPLIDILNRESHSEIVHLALMTLENLSFNRMLVISKSILFLIWEVLY
jgi:GTP cyclohydrolase FolE2